MATIDSLQIEIKANAEVAEKAIDSLISSFGRLSQAMSSVDSKGLKETATALTKVFGDVSIKISNIGNKTTNFAKGLSSANGSMRNSHGILSKLVSGLKGYTSNTERASSSTSRFAEKVGMLYARFWMLLRGIKGIWNSIKSAMDYVETLNYFEASFNQVAENAVANWKESGYDSAEAYYGSFKKRAKEITRKMSGWNINDDGTLSSTKMASLGLNPTELMNVQAQFAQMSNSMGVASETSMLLSEALTKIGADLASVKNMDFNEVWGDMASGLVGMSRTLDKYGVNIRNANMQAKLMELGINANVSALSQADKAMLRTIILLDSTRYAFGDLAKTINQPANQIRLLTANWKMLCQMIGNLFLPLLQKILPIINAVVIALQRLVVAIARLFKIDLSKVTSSVGNAGNSMSDVLDDADGIGEELDDASDSAKKLKKNLMGIDELNIISEDESSGINKGLGATGALTDALADALADYLSAWDDAFNKLSNKAQELADKIEAWFKRVIEPIRKAWERVGQDVVDAWKRAFSSVWELIKSIAKDWAEVWQQENTVKIFENIFNIIKDIGLIVANLADNFRKAWEENKTGKHILENIRDIILGISGAMLEVWDYAVKISESLDFRPLLTAIEKATRSIANNSRDIFGIVADIYKRFLDFGKYLIEQFLPAVFKVIDKVVSGIHWGELRENLNRIWTAIEKLAEVLGNTLLKVLNKVGDWIVKFINGNSIKKLADDFEKLAKSLANSKSLGDVINSIFDFSDSRIQSATESFNSFVHAIDDALKYLNTIDPSTGETPIKTLGKRLANSINTMVKSLDAKALGKTISDLAVTFLNLISEALAKVDWFALGMKIGDFLAGIDWISVLSKAVKILLEVFAGLVKAWLGSMLKAPFETAIATAIGLLVLTAPVLKLVGAIALAMKSASAISKLSTAFKGLFTTSVEKGLTDATPTIKKAVTTSATGAGAGGGWFAGVGTALGTLAGVTIAAGAGTHFGNYINKEISAVQGEEAYDWTGSLQNIVDLWTAWKDNIVDIFTNDSDGTWKRIGRFIVEGIGMGIVSVLSTLLYPFTALFNWVWGGICKVFGIASPAKEMKPLGEFITLGLIEGFLDKLSEWINAFKEMFSKIKEWFGSTVVDPIKAFFSNMWDSIKDMANGVVDTLVQWKENVVTHIKEFTSTTVNHFAEWKDKVIAKVVEWKDKMISTFSEWKENIVSRFVEWKDNIISTLSEWSTRASESIRGWFDETREKFSNWKADVENTISTWKDNTKAKFDEWKENVTNIVETWKNNVKSKFEEFKNSASNTIESWKETTKVKFTEWSNFVQTKFSEWKTKVISTLETWKSSAITKITEFKQKTSDAIAQWKTNVEGKFNEWKNNVVAKIEEFKNKAISIISNFVSTFIEKINSLITKIKQLFNDMVTRILELLTEWKNKILALFDELKTKIIDKVQTIVNTCKEWFSARNWTFDGIRQGLSNSFDSALNSARDKWDSMKNWLGNIGSDIVRTGNMWTGYSYSLNGYATGGFPTSGELFMARENGAPEMVGSWGNRTAVANNGQITQGIADAVYRAMSDANNNNQEIGLLNDILYAIREGKSINIDGRELVKAYDERKTRNGYAF